MEKTSDAAVRDDDEARAPRGRKGKEVRSLREEYKLLTYNRLMKAAQDLFNTVGVNQTTVDDITRRAGTNRTTFYLHFKDKADLGLQMSALHAHEAVTGIQKMVRNGRPSREDIRCWIEEIAEFCRNRKGEIAVASDPLGRDPKYTEASLFQVEETIRRGFANYLTRFSPAEQEEIAAEIFVSMLATQRVLFITIIQGLELSSGSGREALVSTWVSLFERHPLPDPQDQLSDTQNSPSES